MTHFNRFSINFFFFHQKNICLSNISDSHPLPLKIDCSQNSEKLVGFNLFQKQSFHFIFSWIVFSPVIWMLWACADCINTGLGCFTGKSFARVFSLSGAQTVWENLQFYDKRQVEIVKQCVLSLTETMRMRKKKTHIHMTKVYFAA